MPFSQQDHSSLPHPQPMRNFLNSGFRAETASEEWTVDRCTAGRHAV